MAKKKILPKPFTWDKTLLGKRGVRIMGLDLSLRHTGIIVLNNKGKVIHRESIIYKEQSIKKDKFFRMIYQGADDKIYGVKDITSSSNEMYKVKRILAIANRIITLVEKLKISHIALEGYAMGAKGKVFDIAEMTGYVKMLLHEKGFDLYENKTNFYIIPPTTLKGFITGKGNANKSEMLASILLDYGIPFEDDNEADAFSLARMLLELGEEVSIMTQEKGLEIYKNQKYEEEKDKEEVS